LLYRRRRDPRPLAGRIECFVFCFIMPLAQTMIQQWVFENGHRASRMWAFTALGILGSVLHAIIYGLLLTAIFAGRRKADVV
jgi:hypothetical protein